MDVESRLPVGLRPTLHVIKKHGFTLRFRRFRGSPVEVLDVSGQGGNHEDHEEVASGGDYLAGGGLPAFMNSRNWESSSVKEAAVSWGRVWRVSRPL